MDDELLLQKFDVDRACADVQEFNNNKKLGYALAASDYLVAREFQPYAALTPDKALCAMLLIDGLWGTNVSRYDRGENALDALWKSYVKKSRLYQDCISRLQVLKLESDAGEVCKIAHRMLLPLLGEAETRRKHYSFVTKFLHWHAPDHLPITDSRARAAINDLQRKAGIRRGQVFASIVNLGPQERLDEYRRWVEFYGTLIRALPAEAAERLRKQDWESLTGAFQRKNSLLRILDKVFYMRGEPARRA
jgi:hypothetical protein